MNWPTRVYLVALGLWAAWAVWTQPAATRIAVSLSLGAVALGLLLAGWHRFRRGERGLVGQVAWAVSLCLILGWFVIICVGVSTMGYGLTDGMITTVLVTAALAGIGFGLWAHRTDRTRAAPARVGSGLFWFTLGVLFTGVLTITAAVVAEQSRGPGQPESLVNAITGAAVVVTGWALAGLVWWRRLPPGLGAGLATGGTLLGLYYANG